VDYRYTVIENFSGESPASLFKEIGSPVTADGGVYTLYQRTVDNATMPHPRLEYMAIRSPKRTGGIINMQTILDGWTAAGMRFYPPASEGFVILATEGTGTANLTVRALIPDPPVSSSSSSTQSSQPTSTGAVSLHPFAIIKLPGD
jgi:hypothetical protein